MNGMHVLAQTLIREDNVFTILLFLVGACIMIVSVVVCFIRMSDISRKRAYVKNPERSAKFAAVGFFIGIGVMSLSSFCKSETGRYTYQCTFDENVTTGSIEEHFDVISFDNGVWTVKDKEKE